MQCWEGEGGRKKGECGNRERGHRGRGNGERVGERKGEGGKEKGRGKR